MPTIVTPSATTPSATRLASRRCRTDLAVRAATPPMLVAGDGIARMVTWRLCRQPVNSRFGTEEETMDAQTRTLLDRLRVDGLAYDAAQTDRLLRRRNLEPDAAELLALVVRMARSRRVVEIGTSNGYSTIWLADAAADIGGSVTSVDTAPADEAAANLTEAGLTDRVSLVQGDGGAYLSVLADGAVDLLFLDAERTEYTAWWPHPIRVLAPGGVLAIDNVLAPSPEELTDFLALVAADDRLVGTTVEVGKGLHLAWRRQGSSAP
jgi:predicted O-methyltransferase YrrM